MAMEITSEATTTASEDAESARLALATCEKEISNVKALLRALGLPGGSSSGGESSAEEANSLSIAWIKTEGLPEAAEPKLTLDLSSPIEQADLFKPLDPLDEDKSSSVYSFRGVETGQAMLCVTAMDKDIPLGTSTAYDLAPLLKFDATDELQEEIEKDVDVDILPPPISSSSNSSNNKDDEAADEEKEEENAKKEEEETPSLLPICTVTLRFTYVPSKKDRREELYEVLNKISQRKAAAVEKLRKAAVMAARQSQQQQQYGGGGGGGGGGGQHIVPRSASAASSAHQPAVKAGFLNKTQPKKESRLVALYKKHLGPESLVQRIIPVAKNYIAFVGVVLFMHFKGQMLALPPPV